MKYLEKHVLLSCKDIAYLMNVHVNTVYNWIHAGKLRAFKVGRDWRIRYDDLQFLGENAADAEAQNEEDRAEAEAEIIKGLW